MHQHQCSLCRTLWQHGEECDNDIAAHECPACGCHQFRILKDSQAAGAHPLGQGADAAGDPLARLADHDWFVRATTAFALDASDADCQRVVPRLAQMVSQDPYPLVRLAAVEALWRLGPAARPAVGAVTRALVDPEAYVRRAAALTLGSLGSAAGAAVIPLTGSLSDSSPAVRDAAAAALRKIGPVWSPAVSEVWVMP
jgi:HEAT repeat protein